MTEKWPTYLAAALKYSKASFHWDFFSKAWPTLLNSLAFCWLTFKADWNRVYSDSLKKKKNYRIGRRSWRKDSLEILSNCTVTHQSKFRIMVFKPWNVIRHPRKNQRRIFKFLKIKDLMNTRKQKILLKPFTHKMFEPVKQ